MVHAEDPAFIGDLLIDTHLVSSIQKRTTAGQSIINNAGLIVKVRRRIVAQEVLRNFRNSVGRDGVVWKWSAAGQSIGTSRGCKRIEDLARVNVRARARIGAKDVGGIERSRKIAVALGGSRNNAGIGSADVLAELLPVKEKEGAV